MSNRRRNRRTAKGARQGLFNRARVQTRLAANITEEQDSYLDTPDVRLTRIFMVVILLHLIAVGGIFAFKMVDKASATSSVKISSALHEPAVALQQARETAAAVPPVQAPAAEVPARQPVPAPLRPDPSKPQYRVQAGDTLPEIAKRLGVSPEALRAKNAIMSDHELYAGRYLDIPGPGDASAAKPASAPVVAQPVAQPASAPAPQTGKASVYEVKGGDTPWAIARKFNVPFNKLMSENGITNPQSLQIGQKLRIPASN